MITAHVNEQGIVIRFDSPSDHLSPQAWEELLNELKSQYIPGFYQHGKRLHVDVGGDPAKIRAVIYFTDKTVTMDEAMSILKKRNIKVIDVREAPPEP
jgi:hypothetical protein